MRTKNAAILLGLYETGLAVGRSLGRHGIKVIGLDHHKDIGYHSKYIDARLCPHPIRKEKDFIEYLKKISSSFEYKPVLYVTSDFFLNTISMNRDVLSEHLLAIQAENEIFEAVLDKYKLSLIAENVGIPHPKTYCPKTKKDIYAISRTLKFPVFVKGRFTTQWRPILGTTPKGFVAANSSELIEIFDVIHRKRLDPIVQEVIPGPDTNHYKVCVYISEGGDLLLTFTLQKVRQYPVGFGVGSVVKSVRNQELTNIGLDFFQRIAYRGVGSAEFKLDKLDNTFKLIELNPRYWQQNMLADFCGMNFPLVQYLDLTGQKPDPIHQFKTDVKWVNIYDDIRSFLTYRKSKDLSFKQWMISLRGEKVSSDFALDDKWPCAHEIAQKFLRVTRRFLKKALRDSF